MREPEKITTEPEKNIGYRDIKLNDNAIRIIGIPLLGIVIPHAAGLMDTVALDTPVYWLGIAYFVLLSALIWQGNRYLLFRTRQRFTWFDKPIEKLILLVVNTIFYTSPMTIAWLCLWYQWIGHSKPDWNTIQIVTLVNVACVLLITHVYETVFLLKEQQNEQLKNAELSRAKAEAELEALKNQIDPHFMFNSLNGLSYLITSDTTKALKFTEHLADIYRYILSQKDNSLVMLEDELSFVEKYVTLLELRFGSALTVKKHFNGTTEKEYLIPPISVFVAMENAVKHNELSPASPLPIDMLIKENRLLIKNKKQEKKSVRHSSKIGLKNLGGRFNILTGHEIFIENNPDGFTVSLPLIPMNH